MGKPSQRTYALPWPPSVNNKMASVNGRQILTAAARKWYEHAGEELGLQRPKAIKGPVELSIELCAPTKRPYDPDNRIKMTLDALVKTGIIEDDNNKIVRKLTVEPIERRDGCAFVTVTPVAIKDGEAAA